MLIKIKNDASLRTINVIRDQNVKNHMNEFFNIIVNKIDAYNIEPESNSQQRLQQLKAIEVMLCQANADVEELDCDIISGRRAKCIIEHVMEQLTPCLQQCRIQNGCASLAEKKEPTQLENYLILQADLFKRQSYGVQDKFQIALEKIKEFAIKNFGEVGFFIIGGNVKESSQLHKWIPEFLNLMSKHLKLVGMKNNNQLMPGQSIDYAKSIDSSNSILFCGSENYSDLVNWEQLSHFYGMINKNKHTNKIIMPMLLSGTRESSFPLWMSKKDCIEWNTINSNSYFENIRVLIKSLYLNNVMLDRSRSEEHRDLLEQQWDNYVDKIWREFLESIPRNRIPILLGKSEALESFRKEKNDLDEERDDIGNALRGLPRKTQVSIKKSMLREDKPSIDKIDESLLASNPATLFAPNVTQSSDGPKFVVNMYLKKAHEIIDGVFPCHGPASIVKSYF